MSKQVADLHALLVQLADENRKLLVLMDQQHAAMKKMDLKAMGELLTQQEASRLRIQNMETRRKALSKQVAIALRVAEEPSLTRLAELLPQQAPQLIAVRDELRQIVQKISVRSQGSFKLTTAVLGHLNTALKLFAGAVERAGLYTRHGVPRLAPRIGVMEAVG